MDIREAIEKIFFYVDPNGELDDFVKNHFFEVFENIGRPEAAYTLSESAKLFQEEYAIENFIYFKCVDIVFANLSLGSHEIILGYIGSLFSHQSLGKPMSEWDFPIIGHRDSKDHAWNCLRNHDVIYESGAYGMHDIIFVGEDFSWNAQEKRVFHDFIKRKV